jgi:hypothetical protein
VPDHESATAANGPKLMAWLDEKFAGKGVLYAAAGKRAKEWRDGAQAMYYTVDRVLCKLDVHPSEVPEDVWEFMEPKRGEREAA